MKTENDLYEALSNEWRELEKEIFEKYSKLLENNKNTHEKPLKGILNFNQTQRTLWETINLLDQVTIEAMKEKTSLVRCLLTLLTAWHNNYDQPAMKNVSDRFFKHEITNVIKSSHADDAIMNVINNLRQLADWLTNLKKNKVQRV